MSETPHLFYDVFISHNHADKPWASRLVDKLAGHEYNGRLLRPWLDRQFLDPGDLASDAELTSALDRSRALFVVLSPAALGSEWVEFELNHFLGRRGAEDVTLLLIEDCDLPKELSEFRLVDCRSDRNLEARFDDLVAVLCPPTKLGIGDVADRVEAALDTCLGSDPGGLAAHTSAERDDVLAALQQFDIDDAASEGLAVAAYERAADRLLDLHAGKDGRAYNTKMLLGECLATALLASARYRQVAQRFLEISEARTGDPILLFVIARAFSKLAEIDPERVDTTVLLRLSAQLDAADRVSNEQKAIETLVGRIVGKLRDTPAGDLLIKTLIEGGRSSRIAAILGISLSYHRGGPVFYLSDLERIHEQRDLEEELHTEPPSRRLLGLLFASDLDQHEDVAAALHLAKQDIEQDFPGTDFPYGCSWLGLRPEIAVEGSHRTPFIGVVAKATIDNMVNVGAGQNQVSTVGCFTEARIVEALFENCGALLIPIQDADSHQCLRLRGRGVPFAMIDDDTMSLLEDGDVVVVADGELKIWSRQHEPLWPTPAKRKRRKKKKAKRKSAKPRKLKGAKQVMREKIVPRLEAMAPHIDAPLRLGVRLESEGCEPLEWLADFESGAVTIEEREPTAINASLHIDMEKSSAFLGQELSSDNIMHEVWGDLSRFSTLFDAWNAVVRKR